MSGGGGKGGSETTKTEVPDWIKQPAIRNLQRAEDVQRIEYMPYRGPEVAAFNATQNAAMNNNIGAAKAFGLLDPNSTLTATTGMPTPTDFNGFSGYSSMPIYDQALADTKAAQPEAVALYDSLFGANAMAQLNASRNSGRGRGGASPSLARNFTSDINANTMMASGSPNGRSPSGGGGLARQMQKNRQPVNYLTADAAPAVSTGRDYKKEVAMKNAMSSYQPRRSSTYGGNPHSGK